MIHRFAKLFILAGISILTLFTLLRHVSWERIPQIVGLGEEFGPSEEQIGYATDALFSLHGGEPDQDDPSKSSNKIDSSFGDGHARKRPPGQTKPPGSNYTRTLVIARLSREDTTWIEQELQDMLDTGELNTAIYTVDEPQAPFKVPKNKGHEVMVYLSYVIDFYDSLPDIALFMHSHRFAWHNDRILETDASLMVRRLSPERVTREGYMNMRCQWGPGCPAWLHPGTTVQNPKKKEEVLIGESWAELFPFDLAPTVLAQPCCAQFAVSRERIRAIPKSRYIFMRDWLLRTEYSDFLSGRVFEYMWHYIFSGEPVHCPSMTACYCDGYGLCFGSEEGMDYWYELMHKKNEVKKDLKAWQAKADRIDDEKKKHGMVAEEAVMEVPEFGKDEALKAKIALIGAKMNDIVRKAIEKGNDPKQRAIGSGREWNEGDGF